VAYSEKSSPEEQLRRRIIGLGERSLRKSYYPQLQEKIRHLQEQQQKLMETVRTLEEREEALEQLIKEKDVLIREVHHRVKNNYQVIASLLSLGENMVPSTENRKPFRKTRQRIESMSMVYEQLLGFDNFSEVDICEMVNRLVEDLKLKFGKSKVKIVSDMMCGGFYLDIESAIPCTLMVYEVVSNAFEYAFPEGTGNLKVTIDKEDDEYSAAFIEIIDDGPGFPGGSLPIDGSTLGATLLHVLGSQIKTSWTYENLENGRGVSFRLSFGAIKKQPSSRNRAKEA
jgi:two-component system, sensor histidine kinase PdtaS